MPFMIGLAIGAILGSAIVGIIFFLLKALFWVGVLLYYVMKCAFSMIRWFLRKLWVYGKVSYENKKYNLR